MRHLTNVIALIGLIALVCISDRSLAQQSAAIQRFSTPNPSLQLPQSYVFDIAQDEFGFLWFATIDGLLRFDGYNTRVYTDSKQSDSLPSGLVRRLLIDSKKRLWVATYEGLAVFDRETETFTRFQEEETGLQRIDMVNIIESAEDGILVNSKTQLYRVDENNKTLVPYNKNIRFPEYMVSQLDEPSRLWIGSSGNGAFMYDKRSKQLFKLSGMNPWSLNIDAKNVKRIVTFNGGYWLATEQGLHLISDQNTSLQSTLFFEGESIEDIRVLPSSLLIATDSSVYELTKTATANAYATKKLMSGSQDVIFSVYKDSNEFIWIGAENGVRFNSQYYSSIPLVGNFNDNSQTNDAISRQTKNIWGIDETPDGAILSSTQDGILERYNPSNNQFYSFGRIAQTDVWDLTVDENSIIWLATEQGIKRFTESQNVIRPVDTVLENVPVYHLHKHQDKMWAIIDGNQIASVSVVDSAVEYTPLNQDFENLTIKYIDKKDRLWLTDRSQFYIFDLDAKRIVNLPVSLKQIQSPLIAVHESDSFLWLVTFDGEVYKVDELSLSIIESGHIGQDDIKVFSAIGTNGHIWAANGDTLNNFDLDTLSVVTSIKPQQLSYNRFYEGVTIKTTDGLIGFGGKYGYHIFDPEQWQPKRGNAAISRSPLIMNLSLNAETLGFKDVRAPHNKPIYLSDALSLRYDDDRIGFSFSTVNPVSPAEVQYRYKLEGYDTDWVKTEDNSRRAIFHNIPSGEYTMLVQAKEVFRDWSPATPLKLTITPPPWFSRPAIVFYVIFLVLATLYLTRQYRQRSEIQAAIKESEQRLKFTLWSSGDELWDWDILRGRVHRSNTWGIIDFPQDDMRTNSSYDGNIHSADSERVRQILEKHLKGDTEYYEASYRVKTFKDKWIWVLDRGKVVERDHNQQALRMTGTLKNIQHLKESEEQMKLFERSIQNISEGVFITDTHFKFISINQAYCDFTGETKEQALASYLYFHQYPSAFTDEIKKTLRQRGNWSGELESRRVNGERYEMELNVDAVHDDDGKVSHYVGVFSDITTRKSTEKELLKLANSDPLTGLPNRSFFQATQQNLVRKNEAHTLLCLDMDNFKKINDSLGHQTGDVLIKQIAKRLQRITGKSATCYRLGGDEFSILIEDAADIHQVTHFAQNVLDSLARPFIINKQEFVLGVSVGIALYPNDGVTHQELLKNADTAMYYAKNAGGNNYKFFSGEMNQSAVRQLQIENLIRQGIKDDLFNVFYQPKVDIASGRLVSMEALVRFEHPQKGIVSPSQFIPLAEQSGQIIEIGEIVLEKAMRDTKRWVDAGLFQGRVAVNISAKQFELPDLDDRISRLLSKVGISAVHLECEITEGTLMENPEQGLRMMDRLKEKGIHLALDDFGTGYSSLAYLKRFPINTLKIDKAFIDDIAESNVDRHMAAAIINIAHNLGLAVVAEGVEHEEQLAILRRYDCEMLQGYLYSKPLRAEKFESLLKENIGLHQFLSENTTPG